MSRKIVSVDLDATFLKDDKTISEEAIKFVQDFVSKGNNFIINTGRPHQGAVQFLKLLKIHEPMIVNNGGAIVWFDNEYKNIIKSITFSMDIEIVKDFNEEIKEYLNTALITCLFDNYSYDISKCPFWVIHKDPSVKIHEGDLSKILNNEPIRSEYYVKEEFLTQFEKVLQKEKYKQNFSIIRWGYFDHQFSYEIFAKNANKGDSLKFLAKKLNVSMNNSYGFGDQLNDIDLLLAANDGVAMINSREEVKSIANHISKYDNNNDGVIKYLKENIKE